MNHPSSVPLTSCAILLAALLQQASVIPKSAEDRLIQDLVGQIGGNSVRGVDFVQRTEADQACDRLLLIGKPAVPFLVRALGAPSGWAKVHAMEVLAKLHAREAVQPMLEIMRHDKEVGVRGVAAWNLGYLGDRSVVPALLEACDSEERDVFRGAWFALGELKEPQAIPILTKQLSAKVMAIPSGAEVPDSVPVDALVKIGSPAVPALIKRFETGTEDVRLAAARGLGEIGSDPAMTALLSAYANPAFRKVATSGILSSTRPEAHRVAIESLSEGKLRMGAVIFMDRHPDSTFLPALRAAIAVPGQEDDYTDSYFFQVAARVLRKLKDRASVPLLINLIETKQEGVESIRALGEFKDARGLPVLLRIMEEGKERSDWGTFSHYACQAIPNFGPAAVDALAALLAKDPATASVVAQALEYFEDPAAAPKLLALLNKASHPKVRIALIDVLGELKFGKAADTIVEGLASPSEDLRRASIRSLAKLGDSRAIPGLKFLAETQLGPYLGDDWAALGPQVLPLLAKMMERGDIGAANGVAEMTAAESTPLLIQGLAMANPKVVTICARALGKRETKDAGASLLRVLNNPDIDARYEAHEALRSLGYRTG